MTEHTSPRTKSHKHTEMPSSKRKSTAQPVAKQQQLEQLPVLKKPLEQIGKQLGVPGKYWEGRMSADEKSDDLPLQHQRVLCAPLLP